MSYYSIVSRPRDHHDHNGKEGDPKAHLKWPSFEDAHTLLAWYARQAKKINTNYDFRSGLLTMRLYLRKHPHIEFNEDAWTKFIDMKREQGERIWYFRSLSCRCMPWSSRENDLLFLSLLEDVIFPPEDKRRYSYSSKKTEVKLPPSKLVQPRKGLYQPSKGKRSQPRGISVGLDGRPMRKKAAKSRIFIEDDMWGPGDTSGVPFVLKWIVSRENLLMDVSDKFQRLHAAAVLWKDSPLQYWKTLHEKFENPSGNAVIACTYALLDPGHQESFVKQMRQHVNQLDSAGMRFIFNAKTTHGLWEPEDWVPRKIVNMDNYFDRSNSATGGLKCALDSKWIYGVRLNRGRLKRTLDALPEYAVQCLLTDALHNPEMWNCDSTWDFLPRLPLDVREAGARKIAEKEVLWDLKHSLFGPDDDDAEQAASTFLFHVLPEYSDIWQVGLHLGMNLRDALVYLDSLRAAVIPQEPEDISLPQDFSL